MAGKLSTFCGIDRVVIDVNNPNGTFKDETSEGALDGTPLRDLWGSDMWSILERLMAEAGITHNEFPDSQVYCQRYDALIKVIRSVALSWEATFSYSKGEIVKYNGLIYISLLDLNLNQNPATAILYWKSLFTNATQNTQGVGFLPKRSTIANVSGYTMSFGAGNFRFSDGSGEGSVEAMTKNLADNWAPGSGVGGLDVGIVETNTWYDVYQIYRPDTGVGDFLYTVAGGTPNLPANYTKKRLLTSVRAAYTNILPMTWKVFDNFIDVHYNPSILDLDFLSIVPSFTNRVITVPPRLVCWRATVVSAVQSGDPVYYIFSLRNDFNQGFVVYEIANSYISFGQFVQCFTKNDGTIDIRLESLSSTVLFRIYTLGFRDMI